MLLRLLALASLGLAAYEVRTLVGAVILPLLQNPAILQTDFHYYFEAAGRFAADPARLYNPADDVIAGFAYPPPAILPFRVLRVLPFGWAFLVLTIASYAALAIALRMWTSHLRERGVSIDSGTAGMVMLIALALAPAYSNAVFGQVNAFVLLSSVAFLSLGARQSAAAGTALALGAWLKIYPLMIAAVAAWNHRIRRALIYAAVAAFLVFAMSLVVIPASAYRDFIVEVLPSRIDKTALHISNQSLVAFLERSKVTPALFLNWTGEEAVTVSPLVRGINLIVTIAAVGLFWWRSRRGEETASEAGLMALIATAAPLGWGHTYVMVLPLVVLRLVQLRQMRPMNAGVTVLCVAALMIPSGRVLAFANQWPSLVQNLLYSRYLFATALLAATTVGTQPAGQSK